jgi:shikimate dehydrogenase
MKFVSKIDPVAKRAGALNTIIVREKGELEGLNTDVFGFTENMRSAGHQFNPSFPVATILCAGGVARAIIVGLQDMGYQEIRIVNRSKTRAEEMTKAIGGKTTFKIFGLDETEKALKNSGFLINATSLGMEGHQPLDINLSPLPREAWVTDAVYSPLETALIRQARQKNLRAVDGLGMLLHQARAGFKAWFGHEPEVTRELRAFVLEEQK